MEMFLVLLDSPCPVSLLSCSVSYLFILRAPGLAALELGLS